MISTGQAIRTVRAKKIHPVYILFGGEPFLEDCFIHELYDFLSNEGVSKIHYSMDQDSLENLQAELSSISLFEQKRIVVVREIKKIRSEKGRDEILNYIQSPNLNVILVIISEEYDMKNSFLKKISNISKSIDVRTPFENEMEKWLLFYLKKEKIKISKAVLNQYMELYGDYIFHVINEIKNNALILNEDVEVDGISPYNLKGYDRVFPLWSLQDSLGKKDLSLSLEVLNSLLINGNKITLIIMNLVNLYQQMLWKKMGRLQLEVYTGINKIISSRLKVYNKNYTFIELTKVLQELREIDILSKTVSINQQILLEKFFVKTCKGIDV